MKTLTNSLTTLFCVASSAFAATGTNAAAEKPGLLTILGEAEPSFWLSIVAIGIVAAFACLIRHVYGLESRRRVRYSDFDGYADDLLAVNGARIHR